MNAIINNAATEADETAYNQKALDYWNEQNEKAESFCNKRKVSIDFGNAQKHESKTRYAVIEWFSFPTKLKRSRNIINTSTRQLIDLCDTTPTKCQCLEQLTKKDPGTYEQYLEDNGTHDSILSRKRYNIELKEYNATLKMFGDCMHELESFD